MVRYIHRYDGYWIVLNHSLVIHVQNFGVCSKSFPYVFRFAVWLRIQILIEYHKKRSVYEPTSWKGLQRLQYIYPDVYTWEME